MANTKHSAAREIIIDRLLHKRCGYSLYEMLDIVNQSLEVDGYRPVSLNTIRNDIETFQYLYKQAIHVERRGYQNYYMYEDPNFTIFNNVLTLGELQHIHSALLSIRFLDAIQGTHMYEQLSERLCGLLDLDSYEDPIVLYDKFPHKNDLKRFQSLYELIWSKTPITIVFDLADDNEGKSILVHPYFLIKRGDAWNLLCHDATNDVAAEIPISDISRIHIENDIEFIPNNDFLMKDYYKKHFAE